MNSQVYIEMTGIAAGLLNIFATIPQIKKTLYLTNILEYDNQDLGRSILILSGNLLWVIYGFLSPAFAILVACASVATLNLALIGLVLRNRALVTKVNQN